MIRAVIKVKGFVEKLRQEKWVEFINQVKSIRIFCDEE